MGHPSSESGASVRRRVLTVVVAGLAAALHPGVPAFASEPPAPTPSQADGVVRTASVAGQPIDRTSRASVRAAFRTWYRPAMNTAIGWSGAVSGCRPGAPSAAAQAATLSAVNYFREMVDLPSVTFDPALSSNAQQAALMMSANSSLSHFPPTSWRCYTTAGAAAAGYSNLSLGNAGARAVDSQMRDRGAGNTAVGHRRWIQFPPTLTMGSGSTSNANALAVFGARGPRPHQSPVEWPSSGFFPRELEPAGRWSLSIPGADFSDARVVVRRNGGAPRPLTLHPPVNGYGDPTLVWELGNLDERPGLPERTYQVEVSGIRGVPTSTHSYQVTMIDGEPVPQQAPFGSFERAQSDGRRITLSGWAYDPNLPAGGLQVRVSSRLWSGVVRATRPRPDLAPWGIGTNHGFRVDIELPPGTHHFCIDAMDHDGARYTGTTARLGCRQVVVK